LSLNKVIADQWTKMISGLPVEYHKRLADRVVACLGNWMPVEHVEDVLCDMQYHSEQITALIKEDTVRDRYQ